MKIQILLLCFLIFLTNLAFGDGGRFNRNRNMEDFQGGVIINEPHTGVQPYTPTQPRDPAMNGQYFDSDGTVSGCVPGPRPSPSPRGHENQPMESNTDRCK